jgi:lipopolysaccharide export system protein LptA
MRGIRWLLLVAIAAIIAVVALKYLAEKRRLAGDTPRPPAALSADLSATSSHYEYRDTDLATGRVRSDIAAESMQQVKDASRVELKGVVMKIYSKDSKSFDLVKSAAATFDTDARSLFSQGDVEITLNLPIDGPAPPAPTVIKTSGVTCDSNTGRAETDQPSSFVFEKGDGKAVGATYDPTTHELQMKHDVEVHWNPPTPGAKPMKIEGYSLYYHETLGEIWLKPWGRLTRENMVVDGEEIVVKMQDRVIRNVSALHAHGRDDQPARKILYAADELSMDFDDSGVARKIDANKNANLTSTSETAETNVTAGHVIMNFEADGKAALLTDVDASGDAVVTSKPLSVPGHPLTETHVLRSETLAMKMRPGGKEMESVTTKAPGRLEFLPNQPIQHHRVMEGRDFVIAYGPGNHIENFHASNVKTVTDPTDEERKRNRVQSTTASRNLEARFEPKTNKLAVMQQSGEFVYDEGDRHARAAKAYLDEAQNEIVLETGARMWDATGATTANRIRLDQRTGDFTAEGNVNSSRLPDKDQKKNSDMLSGDDPLQATARKMESHDRSRLIHYEGNVNMWQGANRIQAEVIDRDREKRSLIADGKVVSDLWEEPKDEAKKKTSTPILTQVRAGHLVYTDENRLAHYSGGVQLNRPNLQVKGRELRAFLAESGAESRLEKAYVDGVAEIFSTGKDRTRLGTGDQAEYTTADQKVILHGAWVKMVEKIFVVPEANTTEGKELTYFANDDRLLNTSGPEKPGSSLLNRKKKGK